MTSTRRSTRTASSLTTCRAHQWTLTSTPSRSRPYVCVFAGATARSCRKTSGSSPPYPAPPLPPPKVPLDGKSTAALSLDRAPDQSPDLDLDSPDNEDSGLPAPLDLGFDLDDAHHQSRGDVGLREGSDPTHTESPYGQRGEEAARAPGRSAPGVLPLSFGAGDRQSHYECTLGVGSVPLPAQWAGLGLIARTVDYDAGECVGGGGGGASRWCVGGRAAVLRAGCASTVYSRSPRRPACVVSSFSDSDFSTMPPQSSTNWESRRGATEPA